MLNRSQIYTLLMLRNRGDNIFSTLPVELIREISEFGQNPESSIAKALYHAAYAQEHDIKILTNMLDRNPRLLLGAGNVITPGGLEVRRVTLYEFALGAGDAELANLIGCYFSKIPNGEKEKTIQYERYRPAINGMLNQEPYDFTSLIDIVKKSSDEDVLAELNHDMTHKSELRDALIKFRNDFKPGIMTKPRMHCNYQNLYYVFYLIEREWNKINNYNKCQLLWRQVAGYIELRELPACDRQAFAQSLEQILKGAPFKRSFKFKYDKSMFPAPGANADSHSGVGFDCAVDVFASLQGVAVGEVWQDVYFAQFCNTKNLELLKLGNQPQKRKRPHA